MNKLCKTSLLMLSLLFTLNSHADFLKTSTDSMDKINNDVTRLVQKFGGPQILVAYDIDNTLLAPAEHYDLASSQWWDWQTKLMTTEPQSPMLVAKDTAHLSQINDVILPLMNLAKVEPEVDQDITQQQNENINVIALTSRDCNLFSATEQQLQANNINMKTTAFGGENVKAGCFTVTWPDKTSGSLMYTDGIMMTRGHNKGDALQYLLTNYHNASPIKIIVFVDDTETNVDKVDAAFANDHSVLVYSYLYTREKNRYDNFMADVAHAQEDAAGQWNDLKTHLAADFNIHF